MSSSDYYSPPLDNSLPTTYLKIEEFWIKTFNPEYVFTDFWLETSK